VFTQKREDLRRCVTVLPKSESRVIRRQADIDPLIDLLFEVPPAGDTLSCNQNEVGA